MWRREFAAAMLYAIALLCSISPAYAMERHVNPQHPDAVDAGNGTAASPYKTLGYAMTRLKPGDHLQIAAGTYRDALVFPAKPWTRIDARAIQTANINDVHLLKPALTIIEGQGEVLIKGSVVVKDWRASGDGRYSKSWDNETQQVFVNNKALIQVGGTIFGGFPERKDHELSALHQSQGGIWPGRLPGNQDNMPDNSFYYDKDSKTLHVRSTQADLNQQTVEVSTLHTLLAGHGLTDILVRNLAFQHSNTSSKARGGLVNLSGLRITLENLRVSHADSIGFGLIGDDIVLKNSSANHCGQLGINARGKRMQLIDNETSYNNTRGFNKWWEAGGAKFIGNGGLQDSVVSGHKALGNAGDGIWFDWKNRNNTLRDSLAAFNQGFGIHYEASDRGLIINNVSVANTQRGIYLVHSSHSVVAYNLVAANAMQGIAIIDEGRRDEQGQFDFSARGNKVFSNVVAWNADPLVLPTNIADNQSDGNLFIGDADQTKVGLGWINMFKINLQQWSQRTQQDQNSMRLENPIDEAFNQSIQDRNPLIEFNWYQSLRERIKPLAINPEWLQLAPETKDLRPGPTFSNTILEGSR